MSCEKNGANLEVIGFGEKWQGFNWKLKKMAEYLKRVPEKDVVCYVDGYDVICVRPLEGLAEKYAEIQKKTGCKILVATEQNRQMWSYIASFFFGRCEGKMLNAGTFMGYAGDLLTIVQQIYDLNPVDGADDQAMMVQKCRRKPADFHVDMDSEIFLTVVNTMKDVDEMVQQKNAWFVHAPMYGLLDETIRRLKYDPEIERAGIAAQYRRDIFGNKVLMYLFIFCRMYFLAIFLGIAIAGGVVYFSYNKIDWFFLQQKKLQNELRH